MKNSVIFSSIQDFKLISLSADIGGTAGLFLGASLLTVLEMGEFLILSAMSVLSHLSGAGKIKVKRETAPKDSRSYYDGNLFMGKNLDKNGTFGSLFSTPTSGTPTTTVNKIKVQKKT